MTREEGFKVLSYIIDIIEKRKDIKACLLNSVKILDEVLNLENLGFTKIVENDENKILNLFTVNGRLLLFKKSNLYNKYFEWYVDNVTFEEVKTIYAKCNIACKDIEYF